VAFTTEEVVFPSGSDDCAGTLFRPTTDDASVPVVVMAHGFTATRTDGLPPFAERFAEAGLAALTFDYRGFGQSGGSERQVLSIERELEDVAAAISFARSLDGIDPSRLALWGTSFGGGLTFETAANNRAIACAIAQVPFADGPSLLGKVPPLAAARLTTKGLADIAARRTGGDRVMVPAAGEPGSLAAMTSPDALPGFESITAEGSLHENRVAAAIALEALKWRPGRKAEKIRCPLLVQVATRDLDTPPGPATKVAAAAPKGRLEAYDCGHFDVYLPPWFEKVVTDQLDFLDTNLLGG
jgi:dienelactone hydrolase